MPYNPAPDTLEDAVLAEMHVHMQGQAQTLYQELAKLYLGQLPERLHTLHTALREEDEEARNKILHVLKGSSGILGARRLMNLTIQWSTSPVEQEEAIKKRFFEEVDRVKFALGEVCQQKCSPNEA